MRDYLNDAIWFWPWVVLNIATCLRVPGAEGWLMRVEWRLF